MFDVSDNDAINAYRSDALLHRCVEMAMIEAHDNMVFADCVLRSDIRLKRDKMTLEFSKLFVMYGRSICAGFDARANGKCCAFHILGGHGNAPCSSSVMP